MTDYGARTRERPVLPLPAIGIALGLTAAIAGAAEHYSLSKRAELGEATAREWTITGSPCPAVSAADFVRRKLQAPQSFAYDDAVFGRRFGHVSCGAVADHGGRGLRSYPVCQFTSPAVLRVKTPKGEFFFAPGVGKPATISIPHGVPRCVMASNFRL
jgi:hypothetical protein